MRHVLRMNGPQPISIERRHFNVLKSQPYYVCEKTDGVRYMLESTQEGVFLINRARVKTLVSFVRVPKDTILDGDLVSLKNGKMAYVIHDASMVKGVNLTQNPLNERLEKARALVKTVIKTASAPFELRVKTMGLFGKSPCPDLNGFDYATDGLIFTPVLEPVQSGGTHETMFKWKPRDRITVDFEIRNGVDLYVQDKGVPYKETLLHKKVNIPDGSIVECGYGSNGWFVEKIRTDKTYANNRRTFFRTCINLREDVKLEEFFRM